MRIVIKNGKIITEYGVKEGLCLSIKDGIIEGLFLENYSNESDRIIDAKGGYIAPGFIDVHSDYIETMVSPRPTAMMDFTLGIKETERVLAACGITTMYHSLSLIKEDEFSNKPIREAENVKKLLDVINNRRLGLIRNKFHARLEIDNLDMINELKELIKAKKVDLLSIMDHSPGQGQYTDLDIYKDTLKGYREDITENEIDEILNRHKTKETLSFKEINELITLGRECGISVASHDDDREEMLDINKKMGVNISEFPITLNIAKKANEKGMFTVMGAPNVMLGGSHSGNLSAYKGILEGVVDILCSDYYPQGMLHSPFVLNRKYGINLAEAFKLVTLNPAKATRIDDKFGSIEKGKVGDVLIINIEEGLPYISKTIVNGNVVFSTVEEY